MFYSNSFTIWALLLRSLIHFELTLFITWGKSPISFFSMGIFSCPSTICWRYYFFSIEWSWHHSCQKPICHGCLCLFLYTYFYKTFTMKISATNSILLISLAYSIFQGFPGYAIMPLFFFPHSLKHILASFLLIIPKNWK